MGEFELLDQANGGQTKVGNACANQNLIKKPGFNPIVDDIVFGF